MNIHYISKIVSEYFRINYPKIANLSRKIQKFLWYIGIALYNPITDEDTPDNNSNSDYKNTRICFIRKPRKIISSHWIEFTDYRIYKKYVDEYSKDLYNEIINKVGTDYKFTAKEVADIVHFAMTDANAGSLYKFNSRVNYLWEVLHDKYKDSVINNIK